MLLPDNNRQVTGSFLTLLVCLVGLMLAAPFAAILQRPFIVDVFTTVVFFAGMWSLFHNRKILVVGFLLFLPAVLSNWMYAYSLKEFHLYLSTIATTLFMMFNSLALIIYILNQKKPRPDTIYGGICVYLFFGFLWGELYLLTELSVPGSFSLDFTSLDYAAIKAELNYFSFVTLATLGYGEITPVGNMARTLAIIEAVLGQMFVAVFIARLVGFHFSVANNKE